MCFDDERVVCVCRAAKEDVVLSLLTPGLPSLGAGTFEVTVEKPRPAPAGQIDFSDRFPPYAKGSDTSLAAAHAVAPSAASRRDQIEALVATRGDAGMTADEAQAALGSTHQSVSPRVSELAKSGRIVDSGLRRETRTGCKAVVWVIAKKAERR